MADTVPVAPGVLAWARRSALASETDAAEHTGQPVETIAAWEAGSQQPTYAQLERLADEYGLSVNALLLPEAPKGQEPPPDYRSPSEGAREPISRLTRRELRRARYLQELVGDLQVLPAPALPKVPAGREASAIVRGALDLPISRQMSWADEYQAFREWRAALNSLGVLVLQHLLPLDEVRGLSLPGVSRRPPVVLINQADYPNARVFTLLHELGHLVLAHEGGICDPWRLGPRLADSSLEARCNRFAGAVLVPGEHLLQQPEAEQVGSEPDSGVKVKLLTKLGHRYRVSPQVIWYRMHEVGLVSDNDFRALWPQLRPPIRPRRHAHEDQEGGIPRWQRARTGYGPQLINGLLGAVDRGALSPAQLMRALNVGIADIGRLQSEMSGA